MLGVQPATRGISRRRFIGYLIAGADAVAGAPSSASQPRVGGDPDRTSRSTSTTSPTC